MQFNVIQQDNPGSATSEALRRYRIGREAKSSLALGITERQLCVMTGYSISAIRECVKIAEYYSNDEAFLKAFLSHDLPVGIQYRSWGSFLASLGVNTFTKEEATAMLGVIKENVQRIVMSAYGSADPDLAQEVLGQIRAWLMVRVPSTIWSTIDRNFFKYQRCSYCGSDNGDPELLEVSGLLVCRCDSCKSEGVDASSVDWKIVAKAYASYAHECNHTAEIYRTA
jgi:hypothetical protein